jgi:hypothetical protein
MNPMQMKTYDTDALNRKDFGDLLYGLLRSEFILADESFVVALTGGFGAGKSHFLEMWEHEIRSEKDGPLVVHINAWESDHSGEPVLAIVSAISIQLENAKPKPQQAISTLKSAAGRIVRGGISLTKDMAMGYLEAKTGVELDSAWVAIKEDHCNNNLGKSALTIFEHYEARSKAINDLKNSLKALMADSEELRIILVVDELDRCRPTYAIDFLESLKHLFNIKGLAVLLAVDWNQISCTAEALFGSNLNTNEYFRKFVTRKVALPNPGIYELNTLIRKLWDRLVRSDSLMRRKRFSYAPRIGSLGNIPAAIILGSGVTRPRQAEEIFRILSHYLCTDLDQSGMIEDSAFILILVLLSLDAVAPDLFEKIAAGRSSVEQSLEVVLKITRSKIKGLDWNSEYTEAMLIDAFIDRDSGDNFRARFLQTLTEEELKNRKDRRTGMPYFSNSCPESQMQSLAMKLKSLKRFADE